MAQAPIQQEDCMSDHAESSTAAISRNVDVMSITLRSNDPIEFDDIVRLNRAASPLRGIHSTVGTLTSTAVTSKVSSGTKPTSYGTSYPLEGNGKAVIATSRSSLSATNGSASDAEVEKYQDFFGIGDWTGDGTLKGGTTKTRKRQRPGASRRSRNKKPVVIFQDRETPHLVSSKQEECFTVEDPARTGSKRSADDTRYLRRRPISKLEHRAADGDDLTLAEEGRLGQSVEIEAGNTTLPPPPALTPRRRYILMALLVTAVVTLICSVYGAHYTGRAQIRYTKTIIFSATVMLSFIIILAMLTANRALHEALLAGLFESLIGFVLVAQIHEFM